MIKEKNSKILINKKIQECPTCKNKNIKTKDYFPFCSKHCSDIDLSRWFEGNYYFISGTNAEND
tara:strand:+ start:531 stop:722 length:192 start_codon:yes stop_codon:yes gene_type:complete